VFPNLNTSAEEKGAVHIAYLQNFLDELRPRVPVGKCTSCSKPLHLTCVPQIPLDKSGSRLLAWRAIAWQLSPKGSAFSQAQSAHAVIHTKMVE
jgi:hypothetical protein